LASSRGIVLPVGVHRDYHVAARMRETARERGGLSGVARQRDHAHVCIRGFDPPQFVETAIRTAVIHENQFVRASETLHHAAQLGV
jgi:hypothetical protein